MGRAEEAERIAAACTDCGAVYAAHRWPDGKIIPIGHGSGCRCGGSDFVDLSELNDASSSPQGPADE